MRSNRWQLPGLLPRPPWAAALHETEHAAENSVAAVPGESGPRCAQHVLGRTRLPRPSPLSPRTRYLLRLRQPQPELPPGPEFIPVAKQEAHLRAGVAGGKRRAVAVVPAGCLLSGTVTCRRHPEYYTAQERTGQLGWKRKLGAGTSSPVGGTSSTWSRPLRGLRGA